MLSPTFTRSSGPMESEGPILQITDELTQPSQQNAQYTETDLVDDPDRQLIEEQPQASVWSGDQVLQQAVAEKIRGNKQEADRLYQEYRTLLESNPDKVQMELHWEGAMPLPPLPLRHEVEACMRRGALEAIRGNRDHGTYIYLDCLALLEAYPSHTPMIHRRIAGNYVLAGFTELAVEHYGYALDADSGDVVSYRQLQRLAPELAASRSEPEHGQ